MARKYQYGRPVTAASMAATKKRLDAMLPFQRCDVVFDNERQEQGVVVKHDYRDWAIKNPAGEEFTLAVRFPSNHYQWQLYTADGAKKLGGKPVLTRIDDNNG